jgi:hypothetical protein
MTEISVALIDDFENTPTVLRRSMWSGDGTAPANLDIVRGDIRLVNSLCARFDDASESSLRQSLSAHTGPLVLFLDIDLRFDEDKQREAAMNIRNRLSECDHREGSKALEFVENILSESPGTKKDRLDGIDVALHAIDNHDINPLVIRVATGGSKGAEFSRILRVLASKDRSMDCFGVDLTIGSFNDAKDWSTEEVWTSLVLPAVEDLQVRISRCSALPLVRLNSYLSWAAERKHDDPKDHDAAGTLELFLRPPLTSLLDLSESEWERYLWPHIASIPDHGIEMIQRSGTPHRDTLCAPAAWLFALAAYRSYPDQLSWREVFDLKDLSDPKMPAKLPEQRSADAWASYSITPSLLVGVTSHNDSPTLHDTIRRFFHMCLKLFEPSKSKPSPLEKVTLSDSGLSFLLTFDAWDTSEDTERNGGCLMKKLARWRDAYVGRSTGNYQRKDTSEESPGRTSRAILDWWIATSLRDFDGNRKEAFSSRTPGRWILKIRPRGQNKTEVIFCAA